MILIYHFTECYTLFIEWIFYILSLAGRCLSGQFSKCVWSRFGDIVRGICWGGRCILVLWCWQLFYRCWIDVGPAARPILAYLLDVYQSSIFIGDIYLFADGLWRYAWRRIYVSRLEYYSRLDPNNVINCLHTIVYCVQIVDYTWNH